MNHHLPFACINFLQTGRARIYVSIIEAGHRRCHVLLCWKQTWWWKLQFPLGEQLVSWSSSDEEPGLYLLMQYVTHLPARGQAMGMAAGYAAWGLVEWLPLALFGWIQGPVYADLVFDISVWYLTFPWGGSKSHWGQQELKWICRQIPCRCILSQSLVSCTWCIMCEAVVGSFEKQCSPMELFPY